MNFRTHLFSVGLVAGLTALPAFAETAPKPGSHDARVTYATYQEGQVYRINSRLRNVTLVESSPRDQLQPKVSTYFYLKPGDDIPQSKPHLFDIATANGVPLIATVYVTVKVRQLGLGDGLVSAAIESCRQFRRAAGRYRQHGRHRLI